MKTKFSEKKNQSFENQFLIFRISFCVFLCFSLMICFSACSENKINDLKETDTAPNQSKTSDVSTGTDDNITDDTPSAPERSPENTAETATTAEPTAKTTDTASTAEPTARTDDPIPTESADPPDSEDEIDLPRIDF